MLVKRNTRVEVFRPGYPDRSSAAGLGLAEVDWPAWMARAACADQDPELFFPTPKQQAKLEEVKAVCTGCPVREQCAADAAERRTRYGVWGGLTPAERGYAGDW